ncbi:MAG: hypothetical protein IJ001_02175 [Oscillospiraceae bacterium]|nr:hypothetical protein [Oscillospiraceae bacterium]
MKKIISTVLALALMLSLSVTAFASELGGSQDVTAKYEKTETEEAIYNVDIQWGELIFTYSETTEKTWNPDTHTYDTDVSGGWDKTETAITVTNHSNVAVDVAMSVTPVAGTGVNVTLTGGNATLAAGVEGDVDGAASVTGKLTISGTPNSTVTEAGVKVGEITVTIE